MVDQVPCAPAVTSTAQPQQGIAGSLYIPWTRIVMAVMGLRALVTFVGIGVRLMLPQAQQSDGIFNLLLDPWRQFDATRFIDIATHGYQANGLNVAYMPLYPFLLRLAAVLTGGHYLTAGTLVSTCACVVGVGLLWRWTADLFSEAVAWRAVAVYLLFPDAFYLMCAYSESVFLALSAGCLLASHRSHPLIAGLLGSLAVLARLQGVVLVLPIACDVLAHRPSQAWSGLLSGKNRSWLAIAALGAGMPLVTLGAYQKGFSWLVGGSGIVDTFQRTWHITLQPPWGTIRQYLDIIRSPQFDFFHSRTANYVMVWDLLVGLLVLLVLALSWRRLGASLSLYGVASWAFALSRWYSTGRYMLAVMPFFIAVAVWVPNRKLKYFTVVTTLLMVFFAAEFAQGGWID